MILGTRKHTIGQALPRARMLKPKSTWSLPPSLPFFSFLSFIPFRWNLHDFCKHNTHFHTHTHVFASEFGGVWRLELSQKREVRKSEDTTWIYRTHNDSIKIQLYSHDWFIAWCISWIQVFSSSFDLDPCYNVIVVIVLLWWWATYASLLLLHGRTQRINSTLFCSFDHIYSRHHSLRLSCGARSWCDKFNWGIL